MKPLDLAILFHDTYERLAPQFGYETRTDTRKFESGSQNGKLMIATCKEILDNTPSFRWLGEESFRERAEREERERPGIRSGPRWDALQKAMDENPICTPLFGARYNYNPEE